MRKFRAVSAAQRGGNDGIRADVGGSQLWLLTVLALWSGVQYSVHLQSVRKGI